MVSGNAAETFAGKVVYKGCRFLALDGCDCTEGEDELSLIPGDEERVGEENFVGDGDSGGGVLG